MFYITLVMYALGISCKLHIFKIRLSSEQNFDAIVSLR